MKLEQYITYMSEEQKDELVKFIKVIANDHMSKGDLMRLLPTYEKMDSAMPMEYTKKVKELIPNWNSSFHAYDYTNMSFGEIVNIPEKLIIHLNQVFTER